MEAVQVEFIADAARRSCPPPWGLEAEHTVRIDSLPGGLFCELD